MTQLDASPERNGISGIPRNCTPPVDGPYDRAAVTKTIEILPVSGSLGAEIRGVNLAAPLSATVVGDIRAAFAEHLVLFFRDQRLEPQHQVAFGAHFGPVGTYPFAEPLKDHPEVVPVIKEKDQTTNFGGAWHSDTTYLETPPAATLLYAKAVPPHGGDTLFANMYLAYERAPLRIGELPEDTRAPLKILLFRASSI